MGKPNQRRYYTVPEAAELLDVSPATVWRWIAAERLPAYRVGPRGIRIRKEDLDQVVRPVRRKAAKPPIVEEQVDIWAGYDPDRARKALRRGAGALKGVDRDQLLADIANSR